MHGLTVCCVKSQLFLVLFYLTTPPLVLEEAVENCLLLTVFILPAFAVFLSHPSTVGFFSS